MYGVIKKLESTAKTYAKRLIAQGDLTDADYKKRVDDFYSYLDTQFDEAKSFETKEPDWLRGVWQGLSRPDDGDKARRGVTSVDKDVLKDIGAKITRFPNSVNMHRTLKRLLWMATLCAYQVRIQSGEPSRSANPALSTKWMRANIHH